MFEIIFPTGFTTENTNNGNIDVIVNIGSDKSYTGTIFTINNIVSLMALTENKNYFWAAHMVIVNDLNLQTIKSCISSMIEENIIDIAFERIPRL